MYDYICIHIYGENPHNFVIANARHLKYYHEIVAMLELGVSENRGP